MMTRTEVTTTWTGTWTNFKHATFRETLEGVGIW